jgi:hypothetical protein
MTGRIRITRRSVVGLLAAALGFHGREPARAQTAAGCQYGFVNGLLQITGATCELSVPSHLSGPQSAAPAPAPLASSASQPSVGSGLATTPGGTTATTPQRARQLRRRAHHQRKKDNAHLHKKTKRSRQEAQRNRKAANRITCEDFTSQKAAVQHLGQFPEDAAVLDPDGDGAACEHLPPVSCQDFASHDDAEVWVALYGFSPAKDPYHLFRGAANALCPGLDAAA